MIVMASRDEVMKPIITEAWNTTGLHVHRKSLSHMTFHWGHKTEILFSGWPGCSTGMYVLALMFVFFLAFMVEWLGSCKLIQPGANRVASGLFKTALHAVRAGLTYMVVLAVLSFNGGVFIAAVLGHAFGFLFFRSRVLKKSDGSAGSDPQKSSDLVTPKRPST